MVYILTQLLYHELQTRSDGVKALRYKSMPGLFRPSLPALWVHCSP